MRNFTRVLLVLGIIGCGTTALGQATPPGDPPARPAPLVMSPAPGWKAKADAHQQTWKVRPTLRLSMPLKGQGSIFSAARPSPFLVVEDVDTQRTRTWHVLDVRTGTWPNKFTVAGELADPMISPDAKMYAGTVRAAAGAVGSGASSIEVWTTAKTPKLLQTLGAPGAAREFQVVAFLEGDQLLTAAQTATPDGRNTTFTVWDLKEGKALRTIATEQPVTRKQWAISPGGKYLATMQPDKLAVHDLATGQSAGSVDVKPLPDQPAGGRLDLVISSMVFSLDGYEVAALYTDARWSNTAQKYRIVSWDMPTGQVITDTVFDRPDDLRDTPNPSFEISPDNNHFRIGLVLVNREAGKPVFTFTNPVPELRWGGENYASYQNMYDADRLLFAAARGRAGILCLPVPEKELAKGIAAVKSGGTIADANMPPLTVPDADSARVIIPTAGPDTWSLKPDAPEGRLPVATGIRAVPLRHSPNAAARVIPENYVFAGPAANQAAVLYRVPAANQPGTYLRNVIERISLQSGQNLATFETPSVKSKLADLSPDAKHLLLITDDRLDMYLTLNSAQPRHVAGFRPYGLRKDKYNKPLRAAAVIDDTHVMTVNDNGDATLWEVPACKALYHFSTAGQTLPVLSPNRRQVAFHDDTGITILNVATGEVAASFILHAKGPRGPLVFHPDGSRLVTRTGSAHELHAWDLNTGKLISSFGLPTGDTNGMISNPPLSWAGDTHVMHGNALVDLEKRIVVWTFANARHMVVMSDRVTTPLGTAPDARHWTLLSSPMHNQPAVLLATPLPHEEARKAAALLNVDDLLILKPGAKVALDVNLVGTDATRKETTDHLTTELKRIGATVDPASPVKLTATCTQVETRNETYGEGMFGRNNQTTVSIPVYENRLALIADGKTLFEHKRRAGGYGPSSVHLREGESIQGEVNKMHQDPARGFFTAYSLPRYLARTTPEGLGYSQFTTKGPIDTPRPAPPQR